jgi:uncharacterized protein
MVGNSISVIIKPTNFCNLNCIYCYDSENKDNGEMDEKTLENSIKKIQNNFSSVSWIWHGGEPLLRGLDFFKKAKGLEEKYKKGDSRIKNGMQTNATLIDKDWIDFIKETNSFHMGISIDGPKEINDKTRIFKNWRGTYNRIYRGISLLSENRFGIGAVCVINKNNFNKSNELYHFFRTNKINVKFNPLISAGEALKSFEDVGISSKEYNFFLKEMWQNYKKDSYLRGEAPIEIDPFIEFISNKIIKTPIGCNFSESCRDSFLSITPSGDIYPCGRFEGEKDFYMGNINSDSLEKVLSSRIEGKLKRRGLEEIDSSCKVCEIKEICNSGCMHNAYTSGDIMKKDPYCSSYKLLNTLASKELEGEDVLKNEK